MKRKLLIKAMLALALLMGVSWSQARADQLIGYAAGGSPGVYSIPIDGSTACEKLSESGVEKVAQAVLAGDTYYTSTQTGYAWAPTVKHQVWSTGNWTYTEYTGAAGQVPQAACFNPTDGKIYGLWQQNGPNYDFELKTIEYGSTTTVSDAIGSAIPESTVGSQQSFVAMAAAADGTMYAISKNGKLFSVNKDGSYALICNIGVTTTSAGGAAVASDGTLYYAVYSGGSKLYSIDVSSATATQVAALEGGMRFVGLGFIEGGSAPQPAVPTAAPAAPTDVNVDFPPGSLTGTVSFTMPSTLENGTQWSGPCDYTISIGSTIVPGVANYGDPVNREVTVTETGDLWFMVYATNEVGQGSYGGGYSVTVTDTPPGPTLPPAKVDVNTCSFTPKEGELAGTLTFTLPSTLSDGTPWTEGTVNYKVYVGTEQIPGSGAYGATVNVPITVESDGENYVFIQVSNEAGTQEYQTQYVCNVPAVQPSTPAPGDPTNLNIYFTPGNLNGYITFDMPTTYADNTPASGPCNWVVELDYGKAPVARGTANYGDTGVRADFAFPAFDEPHFIRVYLENDGGSNNIPLVPNEPYTVPSASTPAVPTVVPAAVDVNTCSAHFEKGELTGTLTFTLPSTLADGTEWTDGEVKYVVHIGTAEYPGSGAYGAPINLLIAVDSPGDYNALIEVKNEAGAQDVWTQVPFTVPAADPVLGKPNPVTDLTFNTTEGSKQVTISFNMPKTDVNGVTPEEGTPLKYIISVTKKGQYMPIQLPNDGEGTSTYGGTVTDVTFNVNDFGEYTCKVYVEDPEDYNKQSAIVTESFEVVDAPATPVAPGAVTDLVATPTEGSKIVNVKFTMPTKMADNTAPAEGAKLIALGQMGPEGEQMNPYNFASEACQPPFDYGQELSFDIDLSQYDFGTTFNLSVVVVDFETYVGGVEDPLMSAEQTARFTLTAAPVVLGAPADVTDLSVVPGEPGSKQVTVNFTMPRTDVNGVQAPEGTPLRYTINLDQVGSSKEPEKQVTEKVSTYGAPISELITLDEDDPFGQYEVTVLAVDALRDDVTSDGVREVVEIKPVDVPFVATNFNFTTTPGDKNVTITFRTPDTDIYGNTPAEGAKLNYVVLVKPNVEGASPIYSNDPGQEAAYGTDVPVPIQIEEFGEYKVTVRLEDLAAGKWGNDVSEIFAVEQGPATPVAPGAVTDLVATPTEGSKIVNVKFTMPTKMADSSEPAEGAQLIAYVQMGPDGEQMMMWPFESADCHAPFNYGQEISFDMDLSAYDFGMTFNLSVVVADYETVVGGVEDPLMSAEQTAQFTLTAAPVVLGAPADVTDLSLEAGAPGSKTVTVKFTMPTKDVNDIIAPEGTPLNYLISLKLNGSTDRPKLVDGESTYGAKVSEENIEVAQFGEYTVQVVAIDALDGSLMSNAVSDVVTIADAPAVFAPSIVGVTTTPGDRNVTISFKMPTVDPNGNTPAEGASLNYYLSVKKDGDNYPFYNPPTNGEPAAYGAPVDKKIEVPGFGSYSFTVRVEEPTLPKMSDPVTDVFTVVEAPVVPSKPGPVTGLAATVTPGNKNVVVSFKMPEKLDNGSEPAEGAKLFAVGRLYVNDQETVITFASEAYQPPFDYGQELSFDIDLTQYDFGTEFSLVVTAADAETFGSEEPLISTPESTTFTLKDVPVALGAPADVTDFSLEAGAPGSKTVTVKFTMPTKDVNNNVAPEGTPLNYLISLKLNGNTTSAPTQKPGESVYGKQESVTVTVPEFGEYTVGVVAVDALDETVTSNVVSDVVTVPEGPAAPGVVTDLKANTTPGSKKVTVSFTMPTKLADDSEPAEDAKLYPSVQLAVEGEEISMPMMFEFGDGINPPFYAYGETVVSNELDLSAYDFGTTFNVTAVVTDVESMMSGEDPLMSAEQTTSFTLEEAPVTPTASELVGYFVSPTSGEPGVYTISATDGTYTLKQALKQSVSNAVLANDAYYVTTKSGYYPNVSVFHYGYNTSTWEQTLERDLEGNPKKAPIAEAYNPVDGKIYAVFVDEDYHNLFCTYDYATDELTPILTHLANSPSDDFISMAIAADGTVYAVRANGKLYTLDKTTGAATEIGSTGLKFTSAAPNVEIAIGSTIDPATGTFYLADANKLYTINVTTGAATEVAALEGAGRVVGLGMLSTAPAAAKPKPVENVKINFEGEALEGNVSFTTPTQLTDGTDITDDLYYEVKVDGNVFAQSFRPVGYGENITTTNFALEAGEYEFSVSVYTEEAGSSEPVKVTRRIGPAPIGGITPPYHNALNTKESAEDFTMINKNEDTKNWTFDAENNKFYMGFNENEDMNAWFITPDINLEAGKLYEVSINAYSGNSQFTERVAMWLGTEANPDMMFIPVLDRTDVTTTAGEKLTGYMTVKTDGKYYLGIQGCSDKDMFRLYISDLDISAPRSGECPDKVLFDVQNQSGTLVANITLNAPSLDVAGNQLTAIDKIELSRDGNVIKTWDAPAVGAQLTFTDNVPATGTYTYSAVATNSHGEGPVFKVTQFVGTPIPASPTNARVQETSKTGEVKVTWDAPTEDENGNPIDPTMVRYYLVQSIGQSVRPIADDIAGTSYTFQAVAEGEEQDMLQLGVFAKTSAGTAPNAAMTEFYPAGPAYQLPVEESFPDGEVANEFNWAGSNTDTAWWNPETNDSGLDAQDGDNGHMSSTANEVGAQATLYFGKIAIAETAVNPVLTYWYYKFEEDTNTVATLVEADGTTSTINTVVCGPEAAGWTRAYIPLDAYKGKNIRIKLVTTANNFYSTAIDNIRVFDQANKDLTAVNITAPTNANAGTEMPVVVNVLNSGRQTASDYTVELFVDGESVEKKAGTAIAEGESTDVKFNVFVSPAATSLKLKAVVNYTGDENMADNTTEEATVEVKASTLPAPTNLRADNSSGSVVLNWTAPKLENPTAPKAVTDIFDDLASFAVDPAESGWTFVDVDGKMTWTFSDVKFPNEGYKGVGIVYDGATYPSDVVNLTANSGDKCFMLNSALRATNDDWMISPKLTGAAQTVSFFARNVQPAYTETFEVYYSTTGKETADFKLLKAETTTNDPDWGEYSYELPEGAKYFAIRHVNKNDDNLALAIDDITYIPATSDLTSLSLKGYNVYRDNKKINESLVTETTFTDNGNAGIDTDYFVTAVYEQGESSASNIVTPTVGVDSIYGSDITVMAGRGVITVAGAEGMNVAVYTADGRTIFNEEGAATTRIRTEAGVYVVKAGTVTRKVVVK